MESHHFSKVIAAFAASLDGAIEAADIRDALTLRVVDTVGCMLGACDAKSVKIARDAGFTYHRAGQGMPVATIVGASEKLPLEQATFINAIAARYLDFNDIYLSKEAVHPSDNVAIALALAEGLGRSGVDLLTAVLKGYEVHCRLADTVSTRKGGWDNVVLGAIAASVMAGSLLQLTVDQQAAAIAIASTGNVALMETRAGSLSMWKSAAAPYAARAGVFAAIHAKFGMTGPASALEGKYGLFKQVTGASDEDAFRRDDRPWRSFDVHLKAFPAQYFTQTAIEAALRLRGRIDGAEIKKVEVKTFEFGRVAAADTPEKWRPKTRETADHSMPYCVAVAFLDGRVGEAQFEPDRIAAADVQALLKRIDVAEDETLNPLYPARVPSRIAITLADGRKFDEAVDFPLGHSRNAMTPEQVGDKFKDLAQGRKGSDDLLAALMQICSLSPTDLAGALSKLA